MLRSSISRPKLWRCRAQSLCFAGWDREEATDDNEWREKRKNNNNRVKKWEGRGIGRWRRRTRRERARRGGRKTEEDESQEEKGNVM